MSSSTRVVENAPDKVRAYMAATANWSTTPQSAATPFQRLCATAMPCTAELQPDQLRVFNTRGSSFGCAVPRAGGFVRSAPHHQRVPGLLAAAAAACCCCCATAAAAAATQRPAADSLTVSPATRSVFNAATHPQVPAGSIGLNAVQRKVGTNCHHSAPFSVHTHAAQRTGCGRCGHPHAQCVPS